MSLIILMTNVLYFFMFSLFPLNYDQKILGYRFSMFSEGWCCQKFMRFYLKFQFCLGPIAKTNIKDRNLQSFRSLMTCRYIQFLDVLDFLPSIIIRTPWIFVSVKGGVARKLGFFYHKRQSCFIGPILAYTYNLDSSVFYEFDDKDI